MTDEKYRYYLENSRTPNTQRAYQVAIHQFEASAGLLPADEAAIAKYLTTKAHQLNPRTLSLHLTALSHWHRYNHFPHPTQALSIRKLLNGIQREHGRPKQKAKALRTKHGTGKSYLLGAAREAWEAQGYHVHGVALSGIAAENLQAGSGISSRTIASRCYYWNKGEQLLTPHDILVVDEAGMIGSRQLKRLLEEAERHQAKVVLVGDPYQLQAIEAGAAFRAVSERSPTVSLTEIRRQQIPWQRTATVELATGHTQAAIERYAQHDQVHAFATQAMAKIGLVERWNEARLSHPAQTQIILAYTRDDVRDFNQLARERRQQQGELGEDHTVMTARGERQFAQHDRLYFLENNRDLGVKNGTLGTIAAIQGAKLIVRLDASTATAPKTVTLNLNEYRHVEHGYAATVHKSQGVTVDRSYVLASNYLDGHATYVSLSRHRQRVDVFYGRDEFAHEKALVQTLGRERAKDVTTDYPQHFALQRGFEKMSHECVSLSKAASLSLSDARQTEQQYEQFLQQSLKASQTREAQTTRASPTDFSEFKQQFEAEKPEQAQAITEALRPRHEKLAQEAQKHWALLEKASLQSSMPRSAQAELARYAASLTKQKEVMWHLQSKNPALSDKIHKLSQGHERERGRGLDIGDR